LGIDYDLTCQRESGNREENTSKKEIAAARVLCRMENRGERKRGFSDFWREKDERRWRNPPLTRDME